MRRRIAGTRAAAAIAALALVGLAISPIAARQAITPIPYKCPPCAAIANAFVRADIGPAGTWSMGTTGGDPDTPDDDHKLMVYGFIPGGASDVGSSYTTVRVVGPRGATDAMPTQADTVLQIADPAGDRVSTVWQWRQPHRTVVTQTLSLASNPFSGRPDATWVRYELTNMDAVELRLGLRALIDVKLGNNDGAPYIIPGVGAVSVEREFDGNDVPPFWLAFESPTYDPRQLRSVGLLRGQGLTVPDKLLVGWWVTLSAQLWDYPIAPSRPITLDSAVALYYEPIPLAPGATRVLTTSYGVAGNRGGEVFLNGPATTCGSEVPVSLFVSNFGGQPLTGGRATLTVPAGLSLAAGEAATKPLAQIDAGQTGSVVWRLVAGPASAGDFQVSALVEFDGGRRWRAEHTVHVDCSLPTPRPTATSTATAGPRPSPTATPNMGPGVCSYVLSRVPPAAIAQAMSAPDDVSGWGDLCQPSLPPSWWNIKRDRLALLRPSAPYHPLGNPLVFKCQCP